MSHKPESRKQVFDLPVEIKTHNHRVKLDAFGMAAQRDFT